LAEALKSNSSLTELDLTSRDLLLHECISFSLNTGNDVGTKGAIQLSEALKSNTTLTILDLNGNKLVASFHSHSIQVVLLAAKE
jgi:hypothetical protein